MNKKQLIVALVTVILFLNGCGLLVPYTQERQNLQQVDLCWYSILASLNIEKEQPELKKRWDDYWNRLEQYKKQHPEVKQEIIDKMKYCEIVLGMSEDQVLFIAKPRAILKGETPDEKIYEYSANWQREGTGIKAWITIKNGIVTKIRDSKTAYGW